jgi:hypothetical protein
VIGEPEAAVRIEDDVVGSSQRAAEIAVLVEDLDRAGGDVDPFDPAAGIVVRLTVRGEEAVRLAPREAAIVAAIQLAVRAYREAVGTAVFVPSGEMRVMRPASISTKMTLPSGIATGPSGKRKPLATVVKSVMILSGRVGLVPASAPA